MTEKPTIDKVELVPSKPLTKEQEEQCIKFLREHEPPINWELGTRVKALADNRIVDLYIRRTHPKTAYHGHLAEDGVIHIQPHDKIGEYGFLQ